MFVVQFSDLDDMVSELETFSNVDDRPWPPIVRLVVGRNTLRPGQPAVECIGIHVRAIDQPQNTVLACLVVTGTYASLHGKPFGSEETERAEAAWEKVGTLKERIREHLNQRLQDVRISNGIIDLGKTTLQPGSWKTGEADEQAD